MGNVYAINDQNADGQTVIGYNGGNQSNDGGYPPYQS